MSQLATDPTHSFIFLQKKDFIYRNNTLTNLLTTNDGKKNSNAPREIGARSHGYIMVLGGQPVRDGFVLPHPHCRKEEGNI